MSLLQRLEVFQRAKRAKVQGTLQISQNDDMMYGKVHHEHLATYFPACCS